MSFQTWAAFALLFLVLSYTPGPNMLLAASHGMLFGPKRTMATAIGLIAGLASPPPAWEPFWPPRPRPSRPYAGLVRPIWPGWATRP